LIGLPFAYIHHKRRSETGEANSACVPDARVDDSERPGGEQLLRQLLRGHIVIWGEAVGESAVTADVMKISTEICERK